MNVHKNVFPDTTSGSEHWPPKPRVVGSNPAGRATGLK